MKLLSITLAAFFAGSVSAFAPNAGRAFVSSSNNACLSRMYMAEDEVPFFATGATTEDKAVVEEKELQEATAAEVKKAKRISNLRNEKGVDYAPWMNIDKEEEKRIQQILKEKAEAKRKREEQEREVSGNLYKDSQAQELSGTGLNYKIIDGEVELEWATKTEKNTKGFVVKRRPAKTTEFSVIASYTNWGPLASQGADGGIYRYLDDTVTPGGWVYRISECDTSGSESDLCQCLVEVQTQDEQRAALIAGVGIAAFAVLAVVGGILLDPMGGY